MRVEHAARQPILEVLRPEGAVHVVVVPDKVKRGRVHRECRFHQRQRAQVLVVCAPGRAAAAAPGSTWLGRGRHFLGQLRQRRRGFTQSPGDDGRAQRAARAVAGAGQRQLRNRRQHLRRHPAGRRAAAQHQPFDGQAGVAQKTNMPLQLEGQAFQHRPHHMARAMRQLQPGELPLRIGRQAGRDRAPPTMASIASPSLPGGADSSRRSISAALCSVVPGQFQGPGKRGAAIHQGEDLSPEPLDHMVADKRIRRGRRGAAAADCQQHPRGPGADHHRPGLHGPGGERRGVLVVDGRRNRNAGAQTGFLRDRRQQSARRLSRGKQRRQLS